MKKANSPWICGARGQAWQWDQTAVVPQQQPEQLVAHSPTLVASMMCLLHPLIPLQENKLPLHNGHAFSWCYVVRSGLWKDQSFLFSSSVNDRVRLPVSSSWSKRGDVWVCVYECVCACVCMRERERERECVCVHVCVCCTKIFTAVGVLPIHGMVHSTMHATGLKRTLDCTRTETFGSLAMYTETALESPIHSWNRLFFVSTRTETYSIVRFHVKKNRLK